jgi:hypothetical protein
VDIAGGQLVTRPDTGATRFAGGLLALPSNIGHFARDRFAVVPELGVNVGFQLTNHLRAFAGYNFLYWSSVLRPGDQIDRGLNELAIPNFGSQPGTPAGDSRRPAVPFRDSDFWAQGVNFGLEFRY